MANVDPLVLQSNYVKTNNPDAKTKLARKRVECFAHIMARQWQEQDERRQRKAHANEPLLNYNIVSIRAQIEETWVILRRLNADLDKLESVKRDRMSTGDFEYNGNKAAIDMDLTPSETQDGIELARLFYNECHNI